VTVNILNEMQRTMLRKSTYSGLNPLNPAPLDKLTPGPRAPGPKSEIVWWKRSEKLKNVVLMTVLLWWGIVRLGLATMF